MTPEERAVIELAREFDGVVGIVNDWPGNAEEEAWFQQTGHVYHVAFDVPVRASGEEWHGDDFVAIELEPLSDSEPAADERRRAAG